MLSPLFLLDFFKSNSYPTAPDESLISGTSSPLTISATAPTPRLAVTGMIPMWCLHHYDLRSHCSRRSRHISPPFLLLASLHLPRNSSFVSSDECSLLHHLWSTRSLDVQALPRRPPCFCPGCLLPLRLLLDCHPASSPARSPASLLC